MSEESKKEETPSPDSKPSTDSQPQPTAPQDNPQQDVQLDTFKKHYQPGRSLQQLRQQDRKRKPE